MTTMISEVYEAFRSAGVPEDKAKAAAEAMSSESIATKGDISSLGKEVHAIKTDVAVLKWMIGFNLAFSVAMMGMLWKVFS